MSGRHKVTVAATVLDVADDRIKQLEAAFLKSKYRDQVERPDAIPYEACLPEICRSILLARHDNPPDRNETLLANLSALRLAAHHAVLDADGFKQLPAKLRGAVYALIEADPWTLSLKGKRGRPKANASERVATVVLSEYERLFTTAKASHSPDGDFVGLLTEIFGVLQIDDNVEHAARKAIKARGSN